MVKKFFKGLTESPGYPLFKLFFSMFITVMSMMAAHILL